MINISKSVVDKDITLILSGRIDTTTAPELEKEVDICAQTDCALTLDMKGIDYTSSAGLRVILKAQKLMGKKGGFKLKNVNDDVMEVLDITGFLDILTIE